MMPRFHRDFSTAVDAADTVIISSREGTSFLYPHSILLDYSEYFRKRYHFHIDANKDPQRIFTLDKAPARGLSLLLLALYSKQKPANTLCWITKLHQVWADRERAFIEAVRIGEDYNIDWMSDHIATFPGVWNSNPYIPAYILASTDYYWSRPSPVNYVPLPVKLSNLPRALRELYKVKTHKEYREVVHMHRETGHSVRAIRKAMMPPKVLAGRFEYCCLPKTDPLHRYDGCSSFQKHNGDYAAFHKFAAEYANDLLYKQEDTTLEEFVKPQAFDRLLMHIITCPTCRRRVAKYFADAFLRNGFDLVMFTAKWNREWARSL